MLRSGFPSGSEVKASASNAGDLGSIPRSGKSSGEGNGNPLQYSCLENPMDRGAWWATVHRVAKSQTQLNDFTFTFTFLDHKGHPLPQSSVSMEARKRMRDSVLEKKKKVLLSQT